MPYGLPDDETLLPMGDEEDEASGAMPAAPEEDPEVQRLAGEAFPGVEVKPSALKALIHYCMDQYGPGAEDEETVDDGPPGKGKGLLLATFGPPKKKEA